MVYEGERIPPIVDGLFLKPRTGLLTSIVAQKGKRLGSILSRVRTSSITSAADCVRITPICGMACSDPGEYGWMSWGSARTR